MTKLCSIEGLWVEVKGGKPSLMEELLEQRSKEWNVRCLHKKYFKIWKVSLKHSFMVNQYFLLGNIHF
jgi:hypothetical protein